MTDPFFTNDYFFVISSLVVLTGIAFILTHKDFHKSQK